MPRKPTKKARKARKKTAKKTAKKRRLFKVRAYKRHIPKTYSK